MAVEDLKNDLSVETFQFELQKMKLQSLQMGVKVQIRSETFRFWFRIKNDDSTVAGT